MLVPLLQRCLFGSTERVAGANDSLAIAFECDPLATVRIEDIGPIEGGHAAKSTPCVDECPPTSAVPYTAALLLLFAFLMHLLLIPESPTRPPMQSLLYRKVRAFLVEEQLEDQFAIAVMKFKGRIDVMKEETEGTEGAEVPRSPMTSAPFVPSVTSRKSWVPDAQIQQMAREYAEFLQNHQYDSVLVYARGCYLEAMRKASVLSNVPVREVLSEEDIVKLRQKGMAWMKVGLRLKDAWIELEEALRGTSKPPVTHICPTCGTPLQNACGKGI
jgi:hypothetical protein